MTPKPLKKIKCNGNPCEDCRQPYEACGCKCHQTSGTETKWEERFRTLISKTFKPTEVIEFISVELTKAREDALTSDRLSLVEVIRGMKKPIDSRPEKVGLIGLDYQTDGYNSALTDIISRLKV